MMPNKERLQLLVNALRSGEYTQGKNVLAKPNIDGKMCYCCLGVACKVAIDNGLEIEVDDSIKDAPVEFDGDRTVLPQSVQTWYGFDRDDPELINDQQVYINATYSNDTLGYTFDQIADAFERVYLPKSGVADA